MKKIMSLELCFILISFVIVHGCAKTDGESRSTVIIKIENQCPKDITVIYKTLRYNPGGPAFTGTTEDIIEEKTIIPAGVLIKISVFYKETDQYYNNETDYNRYIKIKYNNIIKEYNFEPYLGENKTLIVKSSDFN